MHWWRQIKEDAGALILVAINLAILAACGTVGCLAAGRVGLEAGLFVGVALGALVTPIFANWKDVPEEERRWEEITADTLTLYLDGKMKRYSLLFSVNGGAFAIAKLLNGDNPPGELSIESLSWGAIFFSCVMMVDVWLWGAKMRGKYGERLFRPVGQAVLLVIGSLLISGWVLVATH